MTYSLCHKFRRVAEHKNAQSCLNGYLCWECVSTTTDMCLCYRWGADPSLKDRLGRTCLHHAAWSKDLDTLESLLKAGCDVDARDIHGMTALFFTMDRELIAAVVAHGANIEVVSDFGQHVLHKAAENGEVETILTLRDLGADMLATTHYGRTAIEDAMIFNRPDSLWLLLDAIGNLDAEEKVCRHAEQPRPWA